MKLLAIDTASAYCSAALLLEQTLLTRGALLERGHAQHLLTMVDELLREGCVRLGQLQALAFGCGPGAFTGVRLAASVAQGLAFGAGIPVVPVSDLRALAQQALTARPGLSRVLVCVDARMQEVYWGCFERDAHGGVTPLGAEHVSAPGAVALPTGWSQAPAPLLAAGSGFGAFPVLASLLQPATDVVLDGLLPRAGEIARLATYEVAAGRCLAAELAVPVYLRDEVATPRAGTGHQNDTVGKLS